ncbi:hypothetical protein I6N95_17880 [Vagococcus sp. BWB3-3]|uniref:Uncharacterized protein n=2 Tax=Vagococcus allomyrinae TaxID=2794353 RepID=A0A940P748_9ENTE|nr:hypothetical protein [Vagococcus allomyrinae]
MLVTQSDLRRLRSSVRYLEYYWYNYQRTFPRHSRQCPYQSELASFDTSHYRRLFGRAKKVLGTSYYYLPTRDYGDIKHYAHLSRLLRTSLKRKRPLKGKAKPLPEQVVYYTDGLVLD